MKVQSKPLTCKTSCGPFTRLKGTWKWVRSLEGVWKFPSQHIPTDFLLVFHCNFLSTYYRWGAIGPFHSGGNDIIASSVARRRLGVSTATDSWRSTPAMGSNVTFRLYRPVSTLLMIPFQREICIIGPKFRGFWDATPPFWFLQQLHPLNALPHIKTRVLSHQPWKSVQWFGLCANVRKLLIKKLNHKGQERYISRVRGDWTPVGGMMKLGTLVDTRTLWNMLIFVCFGWIVQCTAIVTTSSSSSF
jgi:hypothetical protein